MDVVKPWMKTVASRRPYVFQPVHRFIRVIWFEINFQTTSICFGPRNSGLPNSPDLNPLNYYIWSVIERVTNKSWHPNVTSLRTAIEAAFVSMDSATLQRACERFRIEAIIQANRDISNNCALQRSSKCHVIFNFSLKTFCLKKLFDLSGFLVTHPVEECMHLHI